MKRILVLGSLNIDLVQRVARIPLPGETLKGSDLQIFVGGKGANQACAAALLGGQVAMAGKVGNDVFANRLMEGLRDAGVNTELVQQANMPSGTAMIFVLPNGENSIVISPAANGDVSVAFALSAIKALQAGDLLLCQLETPLEAVEAALKAAHNNGVVTVLDPAPACALSDDLLASVSVLTPNQTEAGMLLNASGGPQNLSEAESAARKLQARGVETVILKMGALGCLIAHGNTTFASEGFAVKVSDTTAAGDTFNGALAVALASGAELADAARFANAAAALSVTKAGAIASIPTSKQLHQFLSQQHI